MVISTKMAMIFKSSKEISVIIDGKMLIDPCTCIEIIQSLSEKMKAGYIYPDIADQICACLHEHLENGEYAGLDGEFFAMALTMHMQEVNHDEHLWVRWHSQPLPDGEEILRSNPEWQAERLLEARLDNFGFHKVERLPGNIGYVDIRYLHRPNWAGDTAMSAMNFLANTNSLIIDLRNCTGGFPAMIALVVSYLFGEEPIHLRSIYWRDDHVTQQFWTLPNIPGKRSVNLPVYVLISKATFSGGEEFASILQTRKRAIILGEKTDGGAHPGASYRLHPHFELFLPIGRSFDPITGQGLEGIGVTPDISLPQKHAFLAAYSFALKGVLANFDDDLNTGPSKTLAEEARKALMDLASCQKICSRCGYQNPLNYVKCKNCDEPLPKTR